MAAVSVQLTSKPIGASRPLAAMIWAVSAVVVDLPLVPVIPMVASSLAGLRRCQAAA